MKYRTILMFGAPGSGKGTHGKALGMIPGFHHFSSGDAFRAMKPDSDIGRIFAQYSSQGKLVPDEPTIRLCQETIEDRVKAGKFNPGSDILILDGIPRNTNQAQILAASIEPLALINLACANLAPLIERMQKRAIKEGRADDADVNVIKSRFDTYERESRPVLDFYGPTVVRSVEAARPAVVVLRDILNIVAAL